MRNAELLSVELSLSGEPQFVRVHCRSEGHLAVGNFDCGFTLVSFIVIPAHIDVFKSIVLYKVQVAALWVDSSVFYFGFAEPVVRLDGLDCSR